MRNKFKSFVQNAVWPSTFANFQIVFAFTHAVLVVDPGWCRFATKFAWNFSDLFGISTVFSGCQHTFVVSVISSFVLFIGIVFIRKYTIRLLLGYRQQLDLSSKSSLQKIKNLFWYMAIKILLGRKKPKLYSCQSVLPRMAVPPLKATINRLLSALEPIYADKPDKLKLLRKKADDFVKGPGWWLQLSLHIKSWLVPNYHNDWWESFAYLKGRQPLPNNSNYYMMSPPSWTPTKRQCSRAAVLAHSFIDFKRQIETETLPAVIHQDTVPICMEQYRRMMSTVRIPKEEIDEIATFPLSRHIVVSYKNCWFRVDVLDKNGISVTAKCLEKAFEDIQAEVDEDPIDADSDEAMFPALTGLDRDKWAAARAQLFSRSNEATKFAISSIESAIFVVVLEHQSDLDNISRAKYLLHGNGHSLWHDKSLHIIVFPDGHYGYHNEHTPSDAPVFCHANEIFILRELSQRCYEPDTGKVFEFSNNSSRTSQARTERLYFQVGHADLQTLVITAKEVCLNNNMALKIAIRHHTDYGKAALKLLRIPPDGFVQMAIQLAFYRDQGNLPMTYEPAMTRAYSHGRTETIRSMTLEASEFIKAFNCENYERDYCAKLLRKACQVHQQLSRDAANGLGCDRHLFALAVSGRLLGLDVSFLNEVLSMPWTLSTSQVALLYVVADKIDPDSPSLGQELSNGGGFGPVSENGYGLSYLFYGENRIIFHSTSRSDSTNADRMLDQVFSAMAELYQLAKKNN